LRCHHAAGPEKPYHHEKKIHGVAADDGREPPEGGVKYAGINEDGSHHPVRAEHGADDGAESPELYGEKEKKNYQAGSGGNFAKFRLPVFLGDPLRNGQGMGIAEVGKEKRKKKHRSDPSDDLSQKGVFAHGVKGDNVPYDGDGSQPGGTEGEDGEPRGDLAEIQKEETTVLFPIEGVSRDDYRDEKIEEKKCQLVKGFHGRSSFPGDTGEL